MRIDSDFKRIDYGAEKSAQAERNLADIEGMMARLDVLTFDESAAAHCGQIHAELAAKGTPIGPYDVMIAGRQITGLNSCLQQ